MFEVALIFILKALIRRIQDPKRDSNEVVYILQQKLGFSREIAQTIVWYLGENGQTGESLNAQSLKSLSFQLMAGDLDLSTKSSSEITDADLGPSQTSEKE